MADRVMRMSDPSSTQAEGNTTTDAAGSVQRKCASCADDDEDGQKLQRSVTAASVASVASVASASTMAPSPLVGEALRSPSVPLDAAARDFMESRFNRDFSHVRVHAGPTAAESARQMNARAYTVGSRIVFSDGQYAPATSSGRHLLAHELTHTVHQAHGGGNLVQRAEVDDDPGKCKGQSDITPTIDAHVNSELDAVRKAQPAGFEQDKNKHRAFLKAVKDRLEEPNGIESWVDAQARVPSDHSGTKYEGTDKITGPAPLRLAGVVNVAGLCVGSDKFGHFFVDGWSAFLAKDADAAKQQGTDDEIGIQGLGATGVFSNADINADLAGRDFYQSLDTDPRKTFKIHDFISNGWNEVNAPSFYTEKMGKVVWKNRLQGGTWTGLITFPAGNTMTIEVSFTDVDMSTLTLRGRYQETNIQDGSDPWNQTLTRTGAFTGDITLLTTAVKGASTQANPVSGISLTISLGMQPARTGSFKSVGESALIGNWTEEEPSTEKGPWSLKRS